MRHSSVLLLVFAALCVVSSADYVSVVDNLYTKPSEGQHYADDATLTVNDNVYSGKAAIVKQIESFASTHPLQRYQRTSQLYVNGPVVHFTGHLLSEGKPGCAGAVHLLEQIIFDPQGKIVSRRQLWQETESLFDDEINCRESEDAEEYGLSPEEQDLVQLVHDNHHVTERAQIEQYLLLFDPKANITSHGDDTLKGREAVQAVYEPFFKEARSVVFLPVSPIFVNGNVTACIATLYSITETGCVGQATLIAYDTFTETGKIAQSENYWVGTTRSAFLAANVKDCGQPRTAAVVAQDGAVDSDMSALELDGDADEGEEDEDEEEFDFDEDHEDGDGWDEEESEDSADGAGAGEL